MTNRTKLLPSIGQRKGEVRLADLMKPRPEHAQVRVALINPPQTYPRWLATEYQSYMPVGVAMLGAVLELMGFKVKVIDCLAWDHVDESETQTTFGMPAQELATQLAQFSPHVVGITNAFSCFIEDAIAAARLTKRVDPHTRVVLGGIEPSLEPGNRKLLEEHAELDILVVGEGEVTLCELMASYDPSARAFRSLENVAGILYRGLSGIRASGRRAFLEDLDQLPFPAYHLLDMDRMYENPFYARNRMRSRRTRCMPMHTSRGCPYSCTFCSVHSQVGKPNRRHSPEYVVRHVRYVMERYGVGHFHFEDDNLTLHQGRARELFRAIAPLGITWDTPNGVRADTITEDLARLMAESGAQSITIAVESGDQRILNEVVKKHLDLQDVIQAAKHLASADIPTVAFFIIGFPGETERDIRATLEFAKQLALTHNTMNLLFVATPLPGTPLEDECRAEGYFVRPSNNETLLSAIRLNQTPLIRTREFTKAQLFEWSKEVLDVPELVTIGAHTPFFMARSPRAERSIKRLFQLPESTDLGEPLSYWLGPENTPPRVLSEC